MGLAGADARPATPRIVEVARAACMLPFLPLEGGLGGPHPRAQRRADRPHRGGRGTSDRPASVVKELVENSIRRRGHGDRGGLRAAAAGARSACPDDGAGMDRDDALLAIERHATSKLAGPPISRPSPRWGFRGEALSSVAGGLALPAGAPATADGQGTESRCTEDGSGRCARSACRADRDPRRGAVSSTSRAPEVPALGSHRAGPRGPRHDAPGAQRTPACAFVLGPRGAPALLQALPSEARRRTRGPDLRPGPRAPVAALRDRARRAAGLGPRRPPGRGPAAPGGAAPVREPPPRAGSRARARNPRSLRQHGPPRAPSALFLIPRVSPGPRPTSTWHAPEERGALPRRLADPRPDLRGLARGVVGGRARVPGLADLRRAGGERGRPGGGRARDRRIPRTVRPGPEPEPGRAPRGAPATEPRPRRRSPSPCRFGRPIDRCQGPRHRRPWRSHSTASPTSWPRTGMG